MMRLFIAEKPSLARAIASNLGSPVKKSSSDGYIEVQGGNDVVTWCYGHLLENLMPEEYDKKWASWDINTLPITIRQWRLKPRKDAEKQLETIGTLLKKAKIVVNAGDPDREGQLLVDEVLEYHAWQGKTLRLLLNATDRESVLKALSSMRENKEFKNLSDAALCRSRADWLVGMNMSRAATRKFGRTVSVGRVQTPTLSLVVQRDLEIENFKPQTFYTLVAEVKTSGGMLKMEHSPKENRILDKKVADAFAASLKGKTVALTVERAKKREHAPSPYMLATFQKDAEKELGMGAQAALDALQQLYEAQLTSYPRTDHEHLPPEQASSAVKIASAVIQAGFVKEAKEFIPLMQPSKRIYSLPKDAEHHGLVPTGKKPPENLSPKLLKAYELVCRRFVLSLLPDYEYEETSVSFVHEKRKFSCSGEVQINLAKSWRALDTKKTTALALRGDPKEGTVVRVDVNSGKTTPPKPYTEASLIADMRSVAKFVSDPKLKAILKETSGIGTAATQAGIIETLKKRGFIEHKKKNLISTQFGRSVIARMPKSLADPGVTAAWEDALAMIAAGKYKPDDFMQRTDLFVAGQLKKLR
jgi:DNA topoisomerase-3